MVKLFCNLECVVFCLNGVFFGVYDYVVERLSGFVVFEGYCYWFFYVVVGVLELGVFEDLIV